MATRLFLRDLTPTNDPGETERSVVLPVGDFLDYDEVVKALRTTKGASEVNLGANTQAHQDHDDEFFTSFSSEALDAQTINANTWTIALMLTQSSGTANSFMVLSVYIFREPSTVVGFIYDDDTALGSEWTNQGGGRGRVATFSGSAVTVLAGDYLVLEVWRHTPGQSMSQNLAQRVFFEGTTDVVENAAGGDAASYLETPQDLTFAGGAVARRRVGFGGGRAITL